MGQSCLQVFSRVACPWRSWGCLGAVTEAHGRTEQARGAGDAAEAPGEAGRDRGTGRLGVQVLPTGTLWFNKIRRHISKYKLADLSLSPSLTCCEGEWSEGCPQKSALVSLLGLTELVGLNMEGRNGPEMQEGWVHSGFIPKSSVTLGK